MRASITKVQGTDAPEARMTLRQFCDTYNTLLKVVVMHGDDGIGVFVAALEGVFVSVTMMPIVGHGYTLAAAISGLLAQMYDRPLIVMRGTVEHVGRVAVRADRETMTELTERVESHTYGSVEFEVGEQEA